MNCGSEGDLLEVLISMLKFRGAALPSGQPARFPALAECAQIRIPEAENRQKTENRSPGPAVADSAGSKPTGRWGTIVRLFSADWMQKIFSLGTVERARCRAEVAPK